MTALDELRAGRLGELTARMLYEVVAVAAHVRNYPPPADHGTWTVDAVQATAHDFLLERDLKQRFNVLAAQATDDESLRRLLYGAVVNFFRDRGRATVVGRLQRSLRRLLDHDARFTDVPAGQPGAGNVTLATAPEAAPYGGGFDELVRAAYDVTDVNIVRWSPDARREGPLADGPSLLAVSEAVLTEAAGSLRLSELAAVIASRFGVDPRNVPATMIIDDVDRLAAHESPTAPPGFRATSTATPDASSTEPDRDDVAVLLGTFSEREQLVLATLPASVRTIADRTGLAVSSAAAQRQRVLDKLRVLLSDMEPDQAELMALSVCDAARISLGLDPR